MAVFGLIRNGSTALLAAAICAAAVWFGIAMLYPNERLDTAETAFVFVVLFGVLKVGGLLARRIRGRPQARG